MKYEYVHERARARTAGLPKIGYRSDVWTGYQRRSSAGSRRGLNPELILETNAGLTARDNNGPLYNSGLQLRLLGQGNLWQTLSRRHS